MAFWRALSYSKGWSFDVKTFASVPWLDFDWSHLERFSTKENSRMRWTQSGRESDCNGQIGGKLSQLAQFWRINTEGRRQTESKRERQKVDQRGSHLKRRAPKRQVDIRRGVDFALHWNQLYIWSLLDCEKCSYNTRTQLQQQVRSQGACSAAQ